VEEVEEELEVKLSESSEEEEEKVTSKTIAVTKRKLLNDKTK
jgi:hypothetical protein